jgi:hypothetical protein
VCANTKLTHTNCDQNTVGLYNYIKYHYFFLQLGPHTNRLGYSCFTKHVCNHITCTNHSAQSYCVIIRLCFGPFFVFFALDPLLGEYSVQPSVDSVTDTQNHNIRGLYFFIQQQSSQSYFPKSSSCSCYNLKLLIYIYQNPRQLMACCYCCYCYCYCYCCILLHMSQCFSSTLDHHNSWTGYDINWKSWEQKISIFLTRRRICSFLILQEVLEDDDFLKVSSAIRLVNISGMVGAIDLTF